MNKVSNIQHLVHLIIIINLRDCRCGLKNSGIAFQRTMQQILSPLGSKNIIIYIDDILIRAETFEGHLILLKKVINTIVKHNIKIKVVDAKFLRVLKRFWVML